MGLGPGALIQPTANPVLERIIRAKLEQRRHVAGSFGELEALAVRIGLIQNSENPALSSARIVVFAADHGLAVDGIGGPTARSTAATVSALLDDSLPLAVFARLQGLELTVVDAGIAESMTPNARMLARKIAHGTRNCRAGAAMSTEQAHAAMRAGMEIGHTLGGSAVACAGIGIGSAQSAALVLACVSGAPLLEFVDSGPAVPEALHKHVLRVLEEARSRHGHLEDPVELVAAIGGFEVAMMAGLILAAASRRRLIIVDGMSACAALMVASEIAPAVPDYCIYARSNDLPALGNALELVGGNVLFDVGLDSVDGTGAALAWSHVRCAAALLSDFAATSDGSPSTAAQSPAARPPESQR